MSITTKGPVAPPALPPGAVALRPLRMKIGGWIENTYDARLEIDGLTWLRVQGGFGTGQRTGWHPREDWVCLLPALSVSISRYFGELWRRRFDDMEEAARAAVASARDSVSYDVGRARRRLERLERTTSMLAKAGA